jgi:hypothetical protein
MSDSYIDVLEVEEYTRYFLRQVMSLVGASTLVNVEALSERVQRVQEKVERELVARGLLHSSLRVSRSDTGDAYEELLDAIRRFHRYLQSLPPGTMMDAAAFFPGGYTGSRRKPADVLAQGKLVLRGFDVPVNANIPAAPEWKATFTTGCDALEQAISGKGDAARVAGNTTSALQDARREFVAVYNGLAKRLVRAVLQDIGREHEFRSFFLDLQVNEAGARAPEEPADPAQPGGPEIPEPTLP